MKFLVLWHLDIALLSKEMVRAVGDMPAYGTTLEREGKVLARYHVVGAHGGAWIYEVGSHEEFERLLGRAPVFNFARYTIHALADMDPNAISPPRRPDNAGGDEPAERNGDGEGDDEGDKEATRTGV